MRYFFADSCLLVGMGKVPLDALGGEGSTSYWEWVGLVMWGVRVRGCEGRWLGGCISVVRSYVELLAVCWAACKVLVAAEMPHGEKHPYFRCFSMGQKGQ